MVIRNIVLDVVALLGYDGGVILYERYDVSGHNFDPIFMLGEKKNDHSCFHLI